MERQQEWMRLIAQVMHSLAAACQTELSVHLLQLKKSRWVDLYVVFAECHISLVLTNI
jgi:hypothetical protein